MRIKYKILTSKFVSMFVLDKIIAYNFDRSTRFALRFFGDTIINAEVLLFD